MKPASIFKRLFAVAGLLLLAGATLALIFLSPGRQPTAGPAHTEPRLLLTGRDSTGFNLDPDDTSFTQPQQGQPVPAVSRDIDLRTLPQVGPAEKRLGTEFERGDRLTLDPAFIDPVLQAPEIPSAMPAVITDFAGLDLSTWGGGWPPDTNGDIGPDHYIQTVNTSIGIYDRAGTQLAAFTFDTFFDGTSSPCDADNHGDPIVLYDDVSGRWIITDFAWSDFVNGPYYECIAVSKTEDPVSGGWWQYALEAHASLLNDYPKLGVWQDGIYMTANMFDILNTLGSATFEGVRFWALNRDDLIAGNPLNFQYGDLGTAYYSLLPAHARGSAMPAAGTPNYLGYLYGTTTFRTLKLSIDWVTPANSTITGPFITTIATYSDAADVPQPAGPNLDSLAGRAMAQFQYSEASGEGALWTTHSVATSGRAGIRWYEFRNLSGTPTVYQQGTFSPDTTHRWMGSLAVDRDGNMAVVYSASSSSVHPQIRYAGRYVTDTLGTLAQGEATLVAGGGSQTSFNRWGDYASMSIDPLDECTFWMTTEYMLTTGTNWQTRIGAFRFPGCTAALAPMPVENLGAQVSGSDVVLSWSEVFTDTGGEPTSIIAYHVFTDTDPYLGSPIWITETTSLVYTHTGAANGSQMVFYQVVAENSDNLMSDPSNNVGVFPYPLLPGSALQSAAPAPGSAGGILLVAAPARRGGSPQK